MPSRARFVGDSLVIFFPFKYTSPLDGFNWPLNRLKSVVLPAPFGPMMDLNSLSGTENVTLSTAVWPPNVILKFLVSKMLNFFTPLEFS